MFPILLIITYSVGSTRGKTRDFKKNYKIKKNRNKLGKK